MPKRDTSRADGPLEGEATLEQVLVAFQKSLARAMRSAEQAMLADPDFLLGTRALYVVNGVDVRLTVGVRTAQGQERVVVDFEALPERRSTVAFHVEQRPLEVESGAQLVLAEPDPLGEAWPRRRLRATLVGAEEPRGRVGPLAGRPVHVTLVGAASEEGFAFTVETDRAGQVHLELDARTGRLNFAGYASDRIDLGGEEAVWVWAASVDPPAESNRLKLELGRPEHEHP